MAREIKITLPLPDGRMHAHNKGGWRSKSGAVKSYRELANALARQSLPRRLLRASLTARFFWRDKRRRDNFNAAQSIKPAIDGCVDAGIIADDCWEVLQPCSVESFVDRENPRVELIFKEINCGDDSNNSCPGKVPT